MTLCNISHKNYDIIFGYVFVFGLYSDYCLNFVFLFSHAASSGAHAHVRWHVTAGEIQCCICLDCILTIIHILYIYNMNGLNTGPLSSFNWAERRIKWLRPDVGSEHI